PRPRTILRLSPAGPVGTVVARVVFSPNGRMVAIVHWHNYVGFLTLWDVDTGKKKFDLFEGTVGANVAFSPDGRTVACRVWQQILVWDVLGGQRLQAFNDDGYSQVLYSPEGNLLAVDFKYKLWDVAKKKVVKELVEKGESILRIGENVLL